MLGTSRAIAAMLASVLVVAPAFAQPKAAEKASEKDKQIANALVKKAIAKSQAKQHLEAIELYLEAYAVVPLPTLLSNIGTEYQQAQKPVEALKYFCMYLEKDPTGPLRTYATAQAKVLQIELGRGDAEGDADDAVCRQPGEDTGSGAARSGAADDTLTGTADFATTPATPDSSPGRGLRITGIIAGVAGLGALGVGVYYGLEAKKISDDISNHTDPDVPWRDDIRAYEDRGQAYENRQIAGLVAGGALVIGGSVLYLIGRSKSGERMTVVPTASESSAGVTMIGRF